MMLTVTEGVLATLLVMQSIAWIVTDYRRFDTKPSGATEHGRQ
ncbi:hypothetical protein [Rhodococcus erythropolis]